MGTLAIQHLKSTQPWYLITFWSVWKQIALLHGHPHISTHDSLDSKFNLLNTYSWILSYFIWRVGIFIYLCCVYMPACRYKCGISHMGRSGVCSCPPSCWGRVLSFSTAVSWLTSVIVSLWMMCLPLWGESHSVYVCTGWRHSSISRPCKLLPSHWREILNLGMRGRSVCLWSWEGLQKEV